MKNDFPTYVLKLAASLERFHVAAMAMDDWFDHAVMRRGNKPLYAMIEGNPSCRYVLDLCRFVTADLWTETMRAIGMSDKADCSVASRLLVPERRANYVLPNDAIFSKVEQATALLEEEMRTFDLQDWKARALQTCIATFQDTLAGERIDLELSHHWRIPSLAELFDLQELKTTRYSVEFPLLMGFLLGNPSAGAPVFEILKRYAKSYGEAIQIMDDCLLVIPAHKAGKSTQTDLSQGAMTTVTVLTHQSFHEASQKSNWFSLMVKCKKSQAARDEALRIIRESNALERCRSLVDERKACCVTCMVELRAAGYNPACLQELTEVGLGWLDDGPL